MELKGWSVPSPPSGRQGLLDECIWYLDCGNVAHEAVVFVHSGALFADGWDFQIAPLVAQSYRVVVYARKGFFPSVCTAEQVVASSALNDLHRLTLWLQLERFHLVGAAKGGWFAVDYALSHPERLLSLTIVSSHLMLKEPDWLVRADRLKPPFFASLPDDFKEMSPSYRAGCAEGYDEWVRRNKAARVASVPDQSTTEHIIDWRALESIRTSVLLITGDSDLYLSPSMLRLQHSHIRNAQMFIVRESGHNAYWENPDVFNKRLILFLDQNAEKKKESSN